ncbi:hypothetical protein [Halorarius halobius]|jgi:hypothetical protein|uniref:hypothetical protein n=1 Tax=Halorarius halobius TaxID=2962671 RepID=UPI0020CEA043|nr:hypothetical protein [Halorarius halobius]
MPSVEYKISSELNVREAFSQAAEDLGYTILVSRGPCPDYTLRVEEGAPLGEPGDTLRVEAEKLASDFISHGHDVDEDNVDAIFCWRDDLGDRSPAPVLALEDFIDADDTLGHPAVTLATYRDGDLQKRFVGRDTGESERYKLLWENLDDGRTIESNSPSMDRPQLKALVNEIPQDIREAAFVEGDYETLAEWARDTYGDTTITNGYNIAEVETPDGGRIAFRLIGSNTDFRLHHWDQSNTHTSRSPVNLSPHEFSSLFTSIPREVRVSVFRDLDMDSLAAYLSERATSDALPE